MSFEIVNDRTDHNRLAEQFAARLLEEAAPRKPRRVRPEAPQAAVVVPAAPPAEAPPPMVAEASSKVEFIICDQNSPEWRRARMGIPTASSFDAILTPGKTKTEQKTRQTYLLKLAGEIITGEPMEHVVTRDMERGHALEPEARDLYTFQTGADLQRVGFVRNGRAGCSPDSLIGEDGGLEIKTKFPHLLIDVILKDEFPAEHKAQVQGTLWITGRAWWDIAIYWPGLPLFVKRAHRDEAYIAQLAAEIERFNTDLDAVVAQMRQRIDAGQSIELAAA
jgi:hypothetical protein